MRSQLAAVLVVLSFARQPEATVYHQPVDSGPYMEFASDWMSGFLSLRVRTHDHRYDEVIRELMKVQCEGGSPEDSRHRLDVIDRMPLDALLPLDAWDDSLDVHCGCFEDPRHPRDRVACGAVWDWYYELRI
jgi:hypothetical protein